ncbi:MAG TPA: class I SAM-dependent methyltransferase [Rhizomicrobium sp.]|nr:class I SAM-dependent methyltransferase [Rhizomicrobium sp.]
MSQDNYDPRRFQTTVPFYARYRLGYPDLLIARVIERVGLKAGDAVLDLGCGPGLLAIPFARAGMAVTGVDPEPEMLAAAEAAMRDAGVHVALKQGSSYDLPPGIGPFKLVTMGRSFHWMDREATLKILDGLVVPGGAVALLHDVHTKTVENLWRRMLQDIGNEFGRERAFHVEAREKPEHRAHESVLMNSAFAHLERVSVFIRVERTADDIVGLAYSLSTSAPQKLGEQRAAFESRLREELAKLSPEGRFTEIAEMTALIATRP